MIESRLDFQTSDLRFVVEAFCTLPMELRPTHHSRGEDEPGEPLLDVGKFLDSMAIANLGPVLKGSNVEYYVEFSYRNIGTERVKSIYCDCNLDVEPHLAKQFLLHMAAAQPIFGYACAPEERQHRNRVIVKQGINTVESWVGRDLQKYIPGFYWLTLLPDALAEKYSVPISVVENIAQEHIELEGGQHLFRFYERPEDWQSTHEVAALCSLLPGVFDVEKIKPQLATAKNYLELDSALRGWK
ncbi:hypothetical protein EVC37_24595 [Methylocaldum sp. BRCS4]|jgi:hypothetical protein|uniref:hypothetical protein n=1 Tax=Methylocaldum sp. GT1BB TaxID=3438963 RepID=UPI000A327A63|nr:hypothetical protein [Methylocaldum sp. BRCS4]